jgi:hypothetical protein
MAKGKPGKKESRWELPLARRIKRVMHALVDIIIAVTGTSDISNTSRSFLDHSGRDLDLSTVSCFHRCRILHELMARTNWRLWLLACM